MSNKFKIIIAVIAILLLGFGAFLFFDAKKGFPTVRNQQSLATENTATTSAFKTYTNKEWGFEFEYPKDLILKEKVFSNYYSQFNLVLFKSIGKSRDDAILINIVLPEFVDTAFWKSQKNTSKVIVDEVEGVKYEYDNQGLSQTTIIFPFGKLRAIVATGEGSYAYPNELNQILASFRFLK